MALWAKMLTIDRIIMAGLDDWDTNYSYKGKDFTCDGDLCEHYNEFPGGLGAYSVHVAHFPC